ncbi:FliH/SctL family protein [Pontiellaceae bacterium B12219]|nr:FliH/SctL family protein [Pontiellaceae bacterium B12219]
MSNTIFMNSNVLAFVPAAPEEETCSQPDQVDTAALERELRAELEAEYEERLEREVSVRLAGERERFDRTLNQCTANFDRCIGTLRKEIQANVVDLSIRMAEVIVRHELPDRDMLHNLIVKTLEPVSDLQGALVRLSSSDWNLFGEQISNGDHLGVGSTVQFAEDPNLAAGDVIVESRNGIFDARLNERLKLLKETLHERSGRKHL